MQFEWDDAKARLNERRHQVSFEEAASVFDDPYAYIVFDSAHSDDEPRQTIIGFSNQDRLLIVAFVERRLELIRLISARKATPQERKGYEEAT